MLSSGSPSSSASRPAASRRSPMTSRKSEDFPAPLRPVTVKASPEDTAKLTPENTSRPPRRQARSTALSRIGAVLRRYGRGREWPQFIVQIGHAPHDIGLFLAELAQARKSFYKPQVGPR